MTPRGKNILITGAAGGIGAAMARRFAAEGAAGIGIADLDFDAARRLAAEVQGLHPELGARPYQVDVTKAEHLERLAREFEGDFGSTDLLCSNAGVFQANGVSAPAAAWEMSWAANVMSNVHLSNAVLPGMLKRGAGYILITCSAAGLLANMDAPYMVTKHAAVAYAEWLAIQYRLRGIGVSALCSLGVRTSMLTRLREQAPDVAAGILAGGDLLAPEQVAESVVEGLAAETFLILPHTSVRERVVFKAHNRDQWIASMQRQYGMTDNGGHAPSHREPRRIEDP
ncbi:SDR family oxidoreductase [Caenimonas soli]|uniref:SDR family oxidoreductase n=1 Tax=Caenimonas soli TaxID=2735555 RepID=UPI001553A974|nr:SDR family NAD(P)-dependent oxidoreductase [Caenimonas soli]NPC56839.1 SDR family NAD(P)-dependent oxidoreductase [Caenimonas soli]